VTRQKKKPTKLFGISKNQRQRTRQKRGNKPETEDQTKLTRKKRKKHPEKNEEGEGKKH